MVDMFSSEVITTFHMLSKSAGVESTLQVCEINNSIKNT